MDTLLRKPHMKMLALGSLVIIMLVVGIHQAEAASGPKKILRLAFEAQDIKNLDPGYMFGAQDSILQDMIFNGLLRFKPGDASLIEPDLAERYEVSKDGMELTFHLRKGVQTHPFKGYPEGYEFTSEDVVFTLQKSADPKLSSFSGVFKNFTAEAIDKYTVRIRLKERIPMPECTFVNYRGAFMVPKKAYEAIGTGLFRTQPVGTGPFRVVNYVPGQKVVLVSHEKYFRSKPLLDGVEALLMPDVNSREFALIRGEVELIEGPREQAWVEKMKKAPKTVVDITGPGQTTFLSFNLSKKPIDNLLVRQALCYGINRDELLVFFGRDIAGPVCAPIPTYLPSGLTCGEVAKAGFLYKTDLGKAKELLTKAGYPEGFTMEQTITERTHYLRTMENLQAQWKRIGVNMRLNLVDHSTYLTRILQNVNPIVIYSASRPSPDVWLTHFFHSASIVGTGKNPISNFSHCTIIDGEIEAAREETNREKQIELWKKAQYKLLENAMTFPLNTIFLVSARNSRVKYGYEVKSYEGISFKVDELTDIMK